MSDKTRGVNKPLTRRQFVKYTAAGALLAASPLGFPQIVMAGDKKILRIRLYSDIGNLDPAFCLSKNDDIVNSCLQNKLITYKPGKKWDYRLEAAESIEQLSPTEIRFKLKPGIMFTNDFGELTTEDVKFSFERIADPKLESPYAGDWKLLETVEIKDKYTGVIKLKKPFAPIWMTSLPGTAGLIISKKAVEKVGKFTTEHPATAGPYVLSEWKPKQIIKVTRNPLWKGEQPDFDEIHFYPIDDEKTAEIGIEAGDLDFTRISVSSLEKYVSASPKGATVVNLPSLYYSWLGMNVEHPKLKDIRIRKAVQMAMDIPSIMEAAYFGMAEPSTGIIPPGLIGHREKSLVPPAANPEGAKKLLAEAGFPNGLDLTLDCLNKTTIVTQAQVIQANLAEVGINLKVNVHESGTFWVLGSEKDGGGKWKDIQLITNRFSSQPDPYWYTMWFVQDQVGVWNWERFRSDEFDQLHEKAATETDSAKRDTMYRRMQDIMEESGCYRFITHECSPIMYKNNIQPAMNPEGIPLPRLFKTA